MYLVAFTFTALLGAAVAQTPGPTGPTSSQPDARAVAGPWTTGAYVTLAAQGEAVHAAWLEGDRLLYAASTDGGRSWGLVQMVAEDAESGDAGQIRPELGLARDGPVLVFTANHTPHLARIGPAGWTRLPLRPELPGHAALVDLAIVDGEPLVTWLDTRRDPERWLSDVYAWTSAGEERVYSDGGDGVCVCCRPAGGSLGGLPAVAFRDADGQGREVRLVVREGTGWVDRGQMTHGGWAPGGCPADGPIFADEGVVVSDARDGRRSIWRGDTRLATLEDSELMQPRFADKQLFFVAASSGLMRLLSGERELVRTTGRLEPGDPVTVGQEIWVPWQGERAAVIAVPRAER